MLDLGLNSAGLFSTAKKRQSSADASKGGRLFTARYGLESGCFEESLRTHTSSTYKPNGFREFQGRKYQKNLPPTLPSYFPALPSSWVPTIRCCLRTSRPSCRSPPPLLLPLRRTGPTRTRCCSKRRCRRRPRRFPPTMTKRRFGIASLPGMICGFIRVFDEIWAVRVQRICEIVVWIAEHVLKKLSWALRNSSVIFHKEGILISQKFG